MNAKQKELVIRRLSRLAYDGILKKELEENNENKESENVDSFENQDLTEKKISK